MVAYSFQRQFVPLIRLGLGKPMLDGFPMDDRPDPRPKHQTIRREGKKRHARPGEMVQLYFGQRTKQTTLLGAARCEKSTPIYLQVEHPEIRVGGWSNYERKITRPKDLDDFARDDGFRSWEEMGLFWYEHNHADMNDFRGRLIVWQGGAA